MRVMNRKYDDDFKRNTVKKVLRCPQTFRSAAWDVAVQSAVIGADQADWSW